MRILHVILFLALTLNATVHTVDDLITMALKYSPDINISMLNRDAAKERVRQASSYTLPTLDAEFNGGYGGLKFKDRDFNDDTLLSGTLSATQLLYDFGKTGGAITGAKSDVNVSIAALKEVLAKKIYDVKNGYYQLLQNRSLLRVNYENVNLNEKQLYRAKRYFEAGIRTKIDITDAQVRLIEAKLALQNNGYDIKLNRASLEKIIGLSNANELGVVYEKELDYVNLYETLPSVTLTLEAAEHFAYEHRYELKKYAYAINKAMANLRIYNAEYYPGIYARADYTAQKVEETQPLLPQEGYNATIYAKWNLFSGFQTDAKVQEAKIALMRARSEYINTKLAIKQEVDNAYIYLFKSRDGVKLSQSLSIAAKEKHVQAQKRYEHGLSDYIELQQARQNYIDSLASLVTAYYDVYRSQASLDRAIGK
jgi:outer membrane protein